MCRLQLALIRKVFLEFKTLEEIVMATGKEPLVIFQLRWLVNPMRPHLILGTVN